jgi:hypothetical protein
VPKLTLNVRCPECNHTIQASVTENYKDFIIFVCPKCHKNIVCYNNKVDVISDQCVKKLISKKHLQCCGVVETDAPAISESVTDKGLTKDTLIDLKILLETSVDVNDFISKI